MRMYFIIFFVGIITSISVFSQTEDDPNDPLAESWHILYWPNMFCLGTGAGYDYCINQNYSPIYSEKPLELSEGLKATVFGWHVSLLGSLRFVRGSYHNQYSVGLAYSRLHANINGEVSNIPVRASGPDTLYSSGVFQSVADLDILSLPILWRYRFITVQDHRFFFSVGLTPQVLFHSQATETVRLKVDTSGEIALPNTIPEDNGRGVILYDGAVPGLYSFQLSAGIGITYSFGFPNPIPPRFSAWAYYWELLFSLSANYNLLSLHQGSDWKIHMLQASVELRIPLALSWKY